jgi:proteasome lid subunit RPN8/RPN11
MVMLSNNVLLAIAHEFNSQSAREICGFLVLDAARTQYFQGIRNRANLPDSFILSERDTSAVYARAKNSDHKVIAFIHSHKSDLELSREDHVDFTNSTIPWIIVCRNLDKITYRVHFPKRSFPES